MQRQKRILVLCLAAMAALTFAVCCLGCGGQGGGSQNATKAQFEGFEARSIDDLANLADAAIGEARELEEKTADSQQKSKAASSFSEGNTQYRAMNYSEATEKYQEALEYNVLHHGANVNLTLSLLQEGRDEEAFVQALRCVALFPDDAGCLLNAQVAGTACKFSADDLFIWLDMIVNERGGKSVSSVLSVDSGSPGDSLTWNDAYDYNAIWNRIETLLYTGEKSGKSESTYTPENAYTDISLGINNLIEDNPNDEDFTALQAYFEGVAKQLGLGDNEK